MLFKDVSLRNKRALFMYGVYGDSALLVFNGTMVNSVNALMALMRLKINSVSIINRAGLI